MGKKVIQIDPPKSESHVAALHKIKDAMGNECACCVIITCSLPSQDGKMEIEMSFEGEESLAAFLIENAGQVFDDRITERESK